MNPPCPWCKQPMKKVNDQGVYECRHCHVVVHHHKCAHLTFRQYNTPWMSMKKCLACGAEFDEHLNKSIEICEHRLSNRQACADRLKHVIEIEKKRRHIKA